MNIAANTVDDFHFMGIDLCAKLMPSMNNARIRLCVCVCCVHCTLNFASVEQHNRCSQKLFQWIYQTWAPALVHVMAFILLLARVICLALLIIVCLVERSSASRRHTYLIYSVWPIEHFARAKWLNFIKWNGIYVVFSIWVCDVENLLCRCRFIPRNAYGPNGTVCNAQKIILQIRIH